MFSIKRVLSDDGWIPAFAGFDTIVDSVMSDMEKEYQNTSDQNKSTIVDNLIKLWKNGNLSGAVYISGWISVKYLDYSCN